MSQRYSLRFETTERRGETIPITGTRFTIGRRPGNSLQILENSVSGKHAELLVEASGVLLRDLGSTNGTRVGPEKVLEMRLRPGAEVHIGNVGLRFLDSEATADDEIELVDVPRGEFASEAAAGSTIVQDLPEELHVSERKMERARRNSRLPLILMVGVLAVGGAAAWYLTQGGGGGSRRRVQEVVPPAGNLLPVGYSFEGESSAWESREGAPASFLRNARAAFSGEEGVEADLLAGEWAAHESPEVRAGNGRRLTLRAWARAEGDVELRLGLRFSSSGGGPEPVQAWQAVEAGSEFESHELVATVPVGYDRVRAVLHARALDGGEGGSASFDDAALFEEAAQGPDIAFDEYKVYAFGDPVASAVLAKVDRPLLALHGVRTGDGELVALEAREVPRKGLEVTARRTGELLLHLESGAIAAGLGTMGAGGYSRHSVDFEREEVTDVLIGGGFDLVRVSFEGPVRLRGSARSDGDFALVADLSSAGLLVQVRFQEERTAAADLAQAAQTAEREGRLGECLAAWSELLARYPFDERHTAEAEAARARLVREGLEQLRAVEQEVERARFFRLVDLYRSCRADALRLEQRYTPGDIGERAAELRAAIDGELEGLEADLDRYEVQRLRAILTVLEARESARLAGVVREYLEEQYPSAADDQDGGER